MLNIVKTKGKNLSILVYNLFLLREHNIFRHRYIGCLHEIEIWLGEKIGLTLSMRIFQATHIQCPQTLTGAYLSGLREAEKIIRSMADITWQDKYNWTTFLPNSLLFKKWARQKTEPTRWFSKLLVKRHLFYYRQQCVGPSEAEFNLLKPPNDYSSVWYNECSGSSWLFILET